MRTRSKGRNPKRVAAALQAQATRRCCAVRRCAGALAGARREMVKG